MTFEGVAAIIAWGLAVLAVSLVLRTIWVLRRNDIERQIQESKPTECVWCDRQIASPMRACSVIPDCELNVLATETPDERCRRELKALGYPYGDRRCRPA